MRAAGPGACVRVNEVLRVSKADVVEQGWLVQVHQLRVVADSVEVGRVDWLRHRVVEVGVLRTRAQTGPGPNTHRSCTSPRTGRRVRTFGPASSLSLTFMLSVSWSWCRTSPRAYPSPGYGNQKWGSSFSSSCVGAHGTLSTAYQSRPLRTALTIGHPHQPRAPFRAYAPRHTLPQLLCCATPASRILALITLSPALYHSPQASVLAKLASPGFPGATAASAAAERRAPFAAEPSAPPAVATRGG